MMFLGLLLNAIAQILQIIINLYIWVIIGYTLISFVQPNPNNPIVQLLSRLSTPSIKLIHRLIPTIYNRIDFAPLIIIITLKFFDLLIVQLLFQLAKGFQ